MSDPQELAFASEFPAATREQWLRLVDGVLKGAPFDKRLIANTYDGLAIQPLYPRAADARPVTARAPGAPWTVMQRIDHPDPAAANEEALHELENGATGLTIVCKGSINANGYGLDSSLATLDRVLDGIYLDAGRRHRLQRQCRDARRRQELRGAGEEARDRAGECRNAGRAQPARPQRRHRKRRAAVEGPCALLRRTREGTRWPTASAARSRWRTGASSTTRAAPRRRSSPSRSPARSPICARWKPAACRSMRRGA